MHCPKCNDLELEDVTKDKMEYKACVSSCEGVWISKSALEKYWGKKKLKELEDQLVSVGQTEFDKKDGETKKDDVTVEIDEDDDDFDDEDFDDDDFEEEDDEDEDFDDDEEDDDFEEKDDDDYDSKDDYDDEDDDEDYDFEDVDEDYEEEDEEVEEVVFGEEHRSLSRSLISDDGDFEDVDPETAESFVDTDVIDDDDDEPIEMEEDETLFFTSPVSGNPMKRFNANVTEKMKCVVGFCPESECYWIDPSEEILAYEIAKADKNRKTFASLLAYDRPEEEIIEDEDDDDDDL